MSQTPNTAIAVIGIDRQELAPRRGHDARGAIVLRQKWSRGQVEARLGNMPPRLIGMEACVTANGAEAAAGLGQKTWDAGRDARKAAGRSD